MNAITTPISGKGERAPGTSPSTNTLPNTSYHGVPSPTYLMYHSLEPRRCAQQLLLDVLLFIYTQVDYVEFRSCGIFDLGQYAYTGNYL